MMLVKTRLGISSVHGIGVFADEFIARGTPMWKFQPGFDLVLTKEQMQSLSPACREQMEKYTYLDKVIGKYILCSDDGRFYNHSNKPNTGMAQKNPNPEVDVALVDIHPGEEILCDYRTFTSEELPYTKE
jgi:SET domain-containing protein